MAEAAPGTQRCSVYVGDKRAMFKLLQFPLTRQRSKAITRQGNKVPRKRPPLSIKKLPIAEGSKCSVTGGMQAKRGRAPVRPAADSNSCTKSQPCLGDEWALMNWTDRQGETCEKTSAPAPTSQICLPPRANSHLCFPHQRPSAQQQAQDRPLCGLTSLGCSLPLQPATICALQDCSP